MSDDINDNPPFGSLAEAVVKTLRDKGLDARNVFGVLSVAIGLTTFMSSNEWNAECLAVVDEIVTKTIDSATSSQAKH